MKRLLCCSLLLVVAACSGDPAPELYTLRAPDAAATSGCTRGTTIRIVEPVVDPGLDSARIVVNTGTTQTFYQGVRWNAVVGPLLQHYLADMFDRSHLFATVTTEDVTTVTQWELQTQLRDFEVDQSTSTPYVVIRLTATLVDAGAHKPLLSIPLAAVVPVAGKDMAGIVQVFNAQMDKLSGQLLQRLRPHLPGCKASRR